VNQVALLRRFKSMDMKSALELTLLELLEEDDCLVLDGKTWNLLFKLGKTYLGLSAMTVRVKVGVALEELEKEGRIRVEETYDHGGAYLIFRPLEKGEEDGRETDTDNSRESGTERAEENVILSEESGGDDSTSESSSS
jgi:hypothetical protein